MLVSIRIYILFIVSLFLGRTALCQSGYVLKSHLNGDNLLPQNTARYLAFSKNGFLWIATEDGLVCYDGLSIVTFETENSELSKNRIKCLIRTQEGELYAVNEDLNCYSITDNPPAPRIQYVTTLKSLNNYNSASLNLSPQKIQRLFNRFDTLRINKTIFMNLVCEPQGNSGILKHEKGILFFNSKSNLQKVVPLPEYLRWQLGYAQGYFILYHPSGEIICMNAVDGSITHRNRLAPKGQLLWDDKTNQIFFKSESVLKALTLDSNGRITSYIVIEQLPQDQILTVTSGWNKHLVLGTATDGLYIYHRPGFETIRPFGTKKSFYAQAVMPDSNSVLCGPELTRYAPNFEKKIAPLIRSNNVFFHTESDGSIYLCHRNVVFNYMPTTGRIDSITCLPPNLPDQIHLVYPIQSNEIILLGNEAVYLFKGNGAPQFLCNFPKGQQMHQPICIQKKSTDLFLVGTTSGLFELNLKTKKLRHLFTSSPVRCLYPLDKERFLVGTYGKGIFILKNALIYKIPIDHQNYLHYTHTIFEDAQGYLWFTSNHGLFSIQKNSIQKLEASDSLTTLDYYQYTPLDGLPTNEFNGGCFPSSVRLKNQTWSLPSMKGLVWFKPDSLHTYPMLNTILVRHIEINGKTYPHLKSADQIILEERSSQISIRLSSPHWSDAGNLIFEYGITADTSYINYDRKSYGTNPLILQNLSGGTHFLCIRRISFRHDEDEFSPLIIKLIVPKAAYEYWWFYLICFFVLIGIVILYNRWSSILIRRKKKHLEELVALRTSNLREAIRDIEAKKEKIESAALALRKENEFKSNIIKLLSHDIATPLRFINSFLKNGIPVSSEKNSINHNDLTDLRIATTNLEALLNNIVAWIKNTSEHKPGPYIESVDLYQIVSEKIQLFHLACKKKHIEFLVDIPPHTLLETDAFILATAIQNVLGNAINFTRNGNIVLRVRQDADVSTIQIENPLPAILTQSAHAVIDNAITGYGMGLKITQSLLNEVSGSLTLKNDVENHLTLVKITLPTYVGTLKHVDR
ncbi:MAG: HAMP domain-containing histidine kinase [Chitinophagaceae bacterium]|nr:HAMP domain-containing histidine kinase [Chitinophagaceae bacterium]